ncbi:MAG: hypothetical protein MHM6MM_005200 [Cercozoa sp. M6MM]
MVFTPLQSLVGGLLIGVASTAHLAFTGRITGISGIVNGVRSQWTYGGKENTQGKVSLSKADAWRPAFVLGMLVSGMLLTYLFGAPIFFGDLATPAATDVPTHVAMALGGFLVGFGTRMGSGCTSGHGVCGLPRLSKRSFAATSVFMLTGVATASLIDWSSSLQEVLRGVTPLSSEFAFSFGQIGGALSLLAAAVLLRKWLKLLRQGHESVLSTVVSGLVGLGFGAALGIAGMTDSSKVTAFLSPFSDNFDPSLMFVMGGAVVLNLATFAKIMAKPQAQGMSCDYPRLQECKMSLPSVTQITPALVLGSAIFGIGWGLGGVCPGPALVGLGSGVAAYWVYFFTFLVGQFVYDVLMRQFPVLKHKLFLEPAPVEYYAKEE